MVGMLYGKKLPVATFKIETGMQSHPVWVTEVRIAVEAYSWFIALSAHKSDCVMVALSANIVSNHKTSILIASDISWHTSNPEIRKLAAKHEKDFLNNKPGIAWPKEDLEMPVDRRQGDDRREKP